MNPHAHETRGAANTSAQNPLDMLCVGIGPFGLGLACLADPIAELTVAFLDRAPEFNWHPGLLFEDATLQVPFLADLVTMADPTSRFSYLAWLKQTGRLYPFYVRESFYPLRREYNDYCRWAAEQVRGLHWGQEVVAVERPESDGPWRVTSQGADGTEQVWWTRHLVVGTGTVPHMPESLSQIGELAIHAGDYLRRRESLLAKEHVTVVGSGQSAAEVVLDLLEAPHAPAVDWITRSPRFYPMEYSKLSLELTSPDYLDHFRSLSENHRDAINAAQPQLHRGISDETINRIHELLYTRARRQDQAAVRIVGATALDSARIQDHRVLLHWTNIENGAARETFTDAVVAGTGYRPTSLAWLDGAREHLVLDSRGRLSPDRLHRASPDGTLHVLNTGEHTHALTAPDLGMGPLRNAHVLAHVLDSAPYVAESHTTFQSFGRLPQSAGFAALTAPIDHVRTMSGAGRLLRLRPVDLDRDLTVLHGWLTAPRAEAWGLVGADRDTVAAEYRRMESSGFERAWMLEEAGQPLALVEIYDPACSPLAAAYPVRDGDVGLHLFLAPTEHPLPGTSRIAMAAALDLILADPAVQRVVVEPDATNDAIRRINRWAGFTEISDIQLPDKTACLSMLTRNDVRRLCDLEQDDPGTWLPDGDDHPSSTAHAPSTSRPGQEVSA